MNCQKTVSAVIAALLLLGSTQIALALAAFPLSAVAPGKPAATIAVPHAASAVASTAVDEKIEIPGMADVLELRELPKQVRWDNRD